MDMGLEVADLDVAEDVGFYFKYLGGIAFSTLGAALNAPGATAMVATSSKHGLVFFSDLSGVYALATCDLVTRLSKDVGNDDYSPPELADACSWYQPLPGITQLALSADEAILAAVDSVGNCVRFFPLAAMGPSATIAPQWSLQLGGVKQFAWCKAAVPHLGSGVGPDFFLAVTTSQALLVGRYGDERSLWVAEAAGVEGADWCPGGAACSNGGPEFAYSTGRCLVIAAVSANSGDTAALARKLATLALAVPEDPAVVFESVRWVLPDALLLGGTLLDDDGKSEVGDERSCLLTLRGWAPGTAAPPQGAVLYPDTPGYIEEDCTPRLSGPYLHAFAVPQWGAMVRCHRKAADEHIRLMRTTDGEFGSRGSPQAVAITEDKLGIRLPNGPDAGSNYVLGLGFDTTVPLGPLPNPLSAEKPPLVPPPVLIVLTSDGVLRIYAFGHMDMVAPLRPGADAVLSLPLQLPSWAAQLAGSGGAGMQPPSLVDEMTQAAAMAALPDEDDDLEDDNTAGVGPVSHRPETMPTIPTSAITSFDPSGADGRGSLTVPASDKSSQLTHRGTLSQQYVPEAAHQALAASTDDDDLLTRDFGGGHRSAASDSESGEEVTSPGVLECQEARPAVAVDEAGTTSGMSFPASSNTLSSSIAVCASAAAPTGTFSGFGNSVLGFTGNSAGSSNAVGLFGAAATQSTSASTFGFGCVPQTMVPTHVAGTDARSATPWGNAITTGSLWSGISTTPGTRPDETAEDGKIGLAVGSSVTPATMSSSSAPSAPRGDFFDETGSGNEAVAGNIRAATNMAYSAATVEGCLPLGLYGVNDSNVGAGSVAFLGLAADSRSQLTIESGPSSHASFPVNTSGSGDDHNTHTDTDLAAEASMLLHPDVENLDETEDVGFFFKYLGGITFSALGTILDAPGAAAMVAASSKHGLVFFSDLSGVYALDTRDLVTRLSKAVGSDSYSPPNPTDACFWYQPLPGITQLALSADEAVLAAVDSVGNCVRFFPLAAMGPSATIAPQWSLQLGGVKQFAWCKAAAPHPGSSAGPDVFLAVTASRALLVGKYGDESSLFVAEAAGVEGADWCPGDTENNKGSRAFAYSTGRCLVIAAVSANSGSTAALVQKLATLALELAGPAVVFESVRWVLPGSLLLGGTLLDADDGAECSDELSCLLVLRGWAPGAAVPPQGAVLYTDTPGYIEEGCTPRLSGPYLHALAVPRWGTLVRCHRKAADEHIRLMRTTDGEFGSRDSPQAIAITEDKLGIRLPNGPDGGSNYVLGLGFDTTVPLGPLPNPLSAEKPPLVPPPVLLVLTSDGALRAYAFGHLEMVAPLRPGADAIIPLPLEPPLWAASGRARLAGCGSSIMPRMSAGGDMQGSDAERRHAAAAAGLASDSESGEEVTSPGSAPVIPSDNAPAAVAGNVGVNFGFGVTMASTSFTTLPAALAGSTFGSNFASSAAAAGNVGGVAPSRGASSIFTLPLTLGGAIGSRGDGAGIGQFSGARTTAASSSDLASGSAVGSMSPAALIPANTTLRKGGIEASAFGFGSLGLGASQTAQVGGGSSAAGTRPFPGASLCVTLTSPVTTAPASTTETAQVMEAPVWREPGAGVQPTMVSGAIPAGSAVKVMPVITPSRPASPDVPAPRAQLANESKEGASAEASFLRELHEVRRMATKLAITMKDVAAGCPNSCGMGVGYKNVASSVAALARRAAALHVHYERASRRVANLVDGLGSLEGRLDALQLFSGNGDGGTPGPAALAVLEQNLPLEPALDGLRRDIEARLQALCSCLSELEDVLDSWEGPKGGSQEVSARLSTSVLYNTLASSGTVLSAAATRILVLAARLEELGACPLGFTRDWSSPVAGLAAWCKQGDALSGSQGMLEVPRGSSTTGCGTPSGAVTPARATGNSTVPGPQWHTPRSNGGCRSPLLAAGATSPSSHQLQLSPPNASAVDAVLPQLQALSRIGGKVRITSVVRPPPPSERPGAALLQLMATAEAARVALPDALQPASPPRTQLKPAHVFSNEAADAGSKGTVPGQSVGFNFNTLGKANAAPPTPHLSVKQPAAGGADIPKLVAGISAQQAAPAVIVKPKALQPPMPNMAQLQAATKLHAQMVKPAAAPVCAVNLSGAASQPPVPSLALVAQAAQLQLKVAATQKDLAIPSTRPTDSGSSAGSTATSRPPAAKPPPAAQPPVPSPEAMRAAAAAQARLLQQQQPQQPVASGTQIDGQRVATSGGNFGFGFGHIAPATRSNLETPPMPLSGSMLATNAAASGSLLETSLVASASADSVLAASFAPATAAGGGSFGFGASTESTAPNAVTAGADSSKPFSGVSTTMFGAAAGGNLLRPSATSSLPSGATATSTGVVPVSSLASTVGGTDIYSSQPGYAPAMTTGTGASRTNCFPEASVSFSALSFGAGSPEVGGGGNTMTPANVLPFGSFGHPAAGAAGTALPAAGTSLFGSFASNAAASSAAAGATGFGIFSGPSATATSTTIGGSGQSTAASVSLPFGNSSGSTTGGGHFTTNNGIQSKATMPAIQAGVFSAFGHAPAFGSPAAPIAPAFGSPATLGGATTSAFSASSPSATGMPPAASSTFGASGFGTPAAFGSPAPIPPAASAAPFGGGFGQSSPFGATAGVANTFSAFGQVAGGVASSAGVGGGFAAFTSAAPTPPAPASGGFAVFAGQGGGFGGFGATQQQQPQGGAFGVTGGSNGFGAFGGSTGGAATSDLWKPRK